MVKRNTAESSVLVIIGIVGISVIYYLTENAGAVTWTGVGLAILGGLYNYKTSSKWSNVLPNWVDLSQGIVVKEGYGKSVRLPTGPETLPVIENELTDALRRESEDK